MAISLRARSGGLCQMTADCRVNTGDARRRQPSSVLLGRAARGALRKRREATGAPVGRPLPRAVPRAPRLQLREPRGPSASGVSVSFTGSQPSSLLHSAPLRKDRYLASSLTAMPRMQGSPTRALCPICQLPPLLGNLQRPSWRLREHPAALSGQCWKTNWKNQDAALWTFVRSR